MTIVAGLLRRWFSHKRFHASQQSGSTTSISVGNSVTRHDRAGQPIPETRWLALYADPAYRQIATWVSRNRRVERTTWWLGGAWSLRFSPFVTGGRDDGAVVFYHDENTARFGHQRAVENLRAHRHVWFWRAPFRDPGPMLLNPVDLDVSADTGIESRIWELQAAGVTTGSDPQNCWYQRQ
ncbi:hypothetical protein H7H51_03425 [Mycolicibacterium farcinogenes]|nr:hypothetical protein [Mycolicibacterium farcinogenes]